LPEECESGPSAISVSKRTIKMRDRITFGNSTFSGSSSLLAAAKSPRFYYKPGWQVDSMLARFGIPGERWQNTNPVERACLTVCLTNSMRIGEYLGAEIRDVLPDDSVFIRAEKHSVSYAIFLPGINDQLKAFGNQPPTGSLSSSNYARVYRACLRCGLSVWIPGHRNAVRTHAARHLRADEVRQFAGNLGASALLHHRTLRAQSYYGAKKEVSHGNTACGNTVPNQR